MNRYDRIVAVVPFGIVAALAIWAQVATGSLVHVFAGVWASPAVTSTVRAATVIALAFCTVAAAIVWIRPYLRSLQWVQLAAVFVAIDLGMVALTSQLTQTPPNDLVSGTTPVQQLMAAHLAPGARMVNYDPQTYDSWFDSPQGVPDLNIIARLPSVSGYASIVNGNYESVTHTHEQDDLDIGQLSSGTLDRLDLREVVTLPEYFLVPLESMPTAVGDFPQASDNISSDPVLPRGYGAEYNETAYPFYPGPRPALHAGETASWFFGESLRPSSATLVLKHPAGPGTLVSFGTVSTDGSTHWGTPVHVSAGTGSVTGQLPAGEAVSVSVRLDAGSLPPYIGVVTVAGHAYELGGSLSSTIVPGPWHLAGLSQGYAVFTLQKPTTPLTATTNGGRQLPVRVISSTTKSEVVRIDAPAATSVLRSVAWDSGWRATVSVNGAAARRIPLNSVDLVQQVRIPPGNDLVTFHYEPKHLLLASVLSLGATGFLVVLLGGWVVRRRRSAGDAPTTDAPELVATEPVG